MSKILLILFGLFTHFVYLCEVIKSLPPSKVRKNKQKIRKYDTKRI